MGGGEHDFRGESFPGESEIELILAILRIKSAVYLKVKGVFAIMNVNIKQNIHHILDFRTAIWFLHI